MLAGAGLLAAYAIKLQPAVAEWNLAAATSARTARDVEDRTANAPAGSLIVLAATAFRGTEVTRSYVWSWAYPFAVQPPFTQADLTERVSFIVPPAVYCCLREQWLAQTRATVMAWSGLPDRPPAIVLVWNPVTGAVSQETDVQNPGLRSQLLDLAEAETPGKACAKLDMIIGEFLPGWRIDCP